MLSKIPDNIKDAIVDDIKEKFNVEVDTDIIDFLQNFQSKVAVEEGFSKQKTVRFYNLAVFAYNPKKLDSKNTMVRLLTKHDGDFKAADKEFKELGKAINLEERAKREKEKEERVIKPKRHEPIRSLTGGFTTK